MQTKTALVVDDSRVARLTLGKLLRAEGFELIEQGSAEEALQWLQNTSSHPDIIFMDVMMSGMDGLTAIRQIKTDPALAAVPVVICTGKDTEADLEQALATGATAVLSKPPAAEALEQLLADITAPVEEAGPAEAAAVNDAIQIDEILASLRQQIVPELEQKIRHAVADLQQQIAQQQAGNTSSAASEAVADIPRQIGETVQQQLSALKQSFSDQAEQMVSTSADKALEKAINNIGLSDKMVEMLQREGQDWLNRQQAEVRETLQKQLRDEAVTIIEHELDEQLETRVVSLVNAQQQAFDSQRQQDISALRSQINSLRYLSLGAVGVAILALVLAVVI